jgi:hypothetical protein
MGPIARLLGSQTSNTKVRSAPDFWDSCLNWSAHSYTSRILELNRFPRTLPTLAPEIKTHPSLEPPLESKNAPCVAVFHGHLCSEWDIKIMDILL